MQKVSLPEVNNIADYELAREDFRARIMALKDRRRIRVGDHLTFLFENHDTVLYQIQEMMRIERIVRQHDIQHEVDTYNELIPEPGELSASLLIEYGTPELRQVRLRELLGLEDHVWLETGGQRAKARFDERQMSTDRISSVQYVKFRLSPEQAAGFAKAARIVVDHPKYAASAALTPGQLKELAQDLT